MEQPQRGMVVMGPQGPIGVVDEVIYESHGTTPRVLVRNNAGESLVLQPGAYQVDGGVLRLAGMMQQSQVATAVQAQAETVQTMDVPAGQEVVIPVVREEVQVARRQTERGGVRVHKRVLEREEVVEQPTYHEEVTVERVTIGRPVEQAVSPWQEGDTLIIPVFEEMLVVEKRLVVKEEIRITKRRIEEHEQARVVLREEQVEIEELPDSAAQVGGSGTVA